MESTAHAPELLNEGIEHHQAGRLREAATAYARVVAAAPRCGDAWRLLGVVALHGNDGATARRLLEHAIRIDALDVAAYIALAGVGELENKRAEAYRTYSDALTIDVRSEAASIGLARVALALGRVAEASEIAEARIARGTVDAGLFRTLGSARLTLRDYAGAARAFASAVEQQPHPDAYANLAIALMRSRRVEAAIDACENALALDAHHAAALNTLGCLQAAEGDFPTAFGLFERAIALGSDQAHINLGTGLLLAGEYDAGWPYFGAVTAERRANPVFAHLPMWDGAPAPGMRLLVWPEQGIGDTIQFVRFIRGVRDRVGAIALACPPGTIELLRTVDGVDAFVETCPVPDLDAFDAWLPTVKLPSVLGVRADALAAAPYLRADRRRRASFRPHLAAPGRVRVGLVWAGSPAHERDAYRSCPLAEFDVLGDIAGIAWNSLQHGAARAQAPESALEFSRIDAAVTDFADTAAIVAELDLVLTVDTSVAHVAGALGCAAWVLLANQPDWRWGRSGDVSPWYPTLRLFRQGPDGAWAPAIASVARALHELVAARAPA